MPVTTNLLENPNQYPKFHKVFKLFTNPENIFLGTLQNIKCYLHIRHSNKNIHFHQTINTESTTTRKKIVDARCILGCKLKRLFMENIRAIFVEDVIIIMIAICYIIAQRYVLLLV
jgi:hypothetical protein